MKKLVLAAALSVFAMQAHAATFDFLEFDAPGGDFSGGASSGNFNVGTATAGFSTVIGELDGICDNGDCNPASGGDTQDSFNFTVADGFELIGLNVNAEGGPPGLRYSASIGEFTPSLTSLGFETFDINTGGSFLTSPLGAGTYNLSVFGQISSGVDGPFQAFYGIDIEVQAVQAPPVPLPAGLPLLVAGLGALGLMRRRTKG